MAEQKDKGQGDQQAGKESKGQKTKQPGAVPKTESTSEFEGAEDRAPTGNRPVEEKVESSSESGQ
jgi:hypothetical protein